jgi:hypothetical protein
MPLALLAIGCSNLAGPSARQAELGGPEEVVGTVDQIFAVAQSDIPLPLGVDRQYRIAIPDQELAANSAVVRYYVGDRYAAYRFNEVRGTWQRGDLIRAGTLASPSVAAAARAPEGYTQLIAVLYERNQAVRDNDWYINNKTVADRGYNLYSEEYQTNLPFKADFLPGTQASGDTTYEVRFDAGSWWKGQRLTSPRGGDSIMCSLDPCDLEFQYDSAGSAAWVGAQKVTLKYYFYVVAPVSASISGPDTITTEGTYNWTAAASGGDGSTYSYQWEQREVGGTWSSVGNNSATYSRSVTAAADAGKTYNLRVTVTSGGRTAVPTFTYTVLASIEPPLWVYIDGPDIIDTEGRYTWEAFPTGGGPQPNPTYSYTWEYRALPSGNWTTVGYSKTYSRSVYQGDPNFGVRVTVVSGGQGQTDQGAFSVLVQIDGQCSPCRPVGP